jgi:hypothetical protein
MKKRIAEKIHKRCDKINYRKTTMDKADLRMYKEDRKFYNWLEMMCGGRMNLLHVIFESTLSHLKKELQYDTTRNNST